MALQQAFGFLQPILYDADFIPNPLANSTALDAAADDHAFSNILSDASRSTEIDRKYVDTLPVELRVLEMLTSLFPCLTILMVGLGSL